MQNAGMENPDELKGKVVQEFIAIARDSEDENLAWDAIRELRRRGGHEVFEVVRSLIRSEKEKERILAANVLGQLGAPALPFRKESGDMLMSTLEREKSVEVIKAICFALGHLKEARAINLLLNLKNHANADIRYAVTHGLQCQTDPTAIQGLIELSKDSDEDIRDWATFGLGSMIDVDSPEIREALFDRLNDKYPDAKGEAMVGLARRKDERVVRLIIEELQNPEGELPGYAQEAAEEFDHPEINSILEEKGFRRH
ncbi:HEAT repeat domain-containing protein [Pedosphaera parvula]|uniref:PBS lyase HEAT domain protein repeat-containing protein n=1 Tax=Pedosphaera parvula (strain Ellin514) TaxID=320771 RepID=B9XDP1_PEDPL|nr:HEAT repeat domain-containing protein [Pedosphaera parvula]EEF62187.1 conserved hypothetical protein [Pedosphaera parvula Ellin514]